MKRLVLKMDDGIWDNEIIGTKEFKNDIEIKQDVKELESIFNRFGIEIKVKLEDFED